MGSIAMAVFTLLLLSVHLAQVHSFTRVDPSGGREVCLVNDTTKTGEGGSIVSPERCNQFCDLTQGCNFWTWYKRHCDKLPCMDDEHTKVNVCYALSRCDLVINRCDGCTSGKKMIIRTNLKIGLSEERAKDAAETIIRSEKIRREEL